MMGGVDSGGESTLCSARGWFEARMKNGKRLKEKGNIINAIPSNSKISGFCYIALTVL